MKVPREQIHRLVSIVIADANAAKTPTHGAIDGVKIQLSVLPKKLTILITQVKYSKNVTRIINLVS
jgi:hypothetical protein